MKLACASGALHREIEGGELTQLEFLDLCARELACDGVVLDVRHFPRTDDDYLAQVKKMAADWGLSIAALSDAAFFTSEPDRMAVCLQYALALGAPLLAAPLARPTQMSWSDQSARLAAATSLAKSANVTLALRNAPETFAAGTHDCKRASKETDSAWLRYGPEARRLDAASDAAALASNTVLLWSGVRETDPEAIDALCREFGTFRGHVALDDPLGDASRAEIAQAVQAWRAALCSGAQRELNRR